MVFTLISFILWFFALLLMCGIVGFNWSDISLVKKMTNSLKHRGPDGAGYYADKHVSFGHRRLAILDLSKKGKQPMSNEDGSIWVTFNGEIYNFKELRKELESAGCRFRSNTDTEVIIYAYERYGIDCVKKFNGMFSFAIWDINKKTLFLARDPAGIKPLYYYWDDYNFIFSSEVNAILKFKDYKPCIDLSSLSQLFRFRYVPFSNTLFEKIYKIPPATCLVFRDGKINFFKYKKFSEDVSLSDKELTSSLFREIDHSVKEHLVSDVPVGIFLSGGIDSSIVAALASNYNPNLAAFTMDFDNFSESGYAKKVTEHLNLHHYVYHLDQSKALWFFDKLNSITDWPIIDPAMVPNYALSCFAKRKNFKVVLSGDGADEIFGGYDYYLKVARLAKISSFFKAFKPVFDAVLPHEFSFYYKMHDAAHVYMFLNRAFKDNEINSLLNYKFDYNLCYNAFLSDLGREFDFYLNKMLYLDLRYQLAEYFLMKTDKSSMAASVEVRVPYITKNVIDFSFRINPAIKFKMAKNLLKDLALSRNLLPFEIIMRKKQGYGVPINSWISGNLGDTIKNKLDNSLLVEDKIFLPNFITKTLANINKNPHYSNMSWMLYSVESWYRKHFNGLST